MNLSFVKSERFREIERFIIVGGLSFLIDYGLLFALTEFVGINYLYSSGISFVVSVIFNYILCVKYVFKKAGKQSFRQRVLFIGSSIIGLFLNQFCMWIGVEFLKLHYMLTKILATAIVTFWNYVMKRKAVMG